MRHLFTVLFAPRATFEQLREKEADWVVPLIVLGLASFMGVWIIGDGFTLLDIIEWFPWYLVFYSVGVLFIGVGLSFIKWMFRAEAGTFLQLCKVGLFAGTPQMLYAIFLLIGIGIFGADLDAGGYFKNAVLNAVDSCLMLVMSVWTVYLMAIGTAVMIEKQSASTILKIILVLLAVAFVLLMLIGLVYLIAVSFAVY